MLFDFHIGQSFPDLWQRNHLATNLTTTTIGDNTRNLLIVLNKDQTNMVDSKDTKENEKFLKEADFINRSTNNHQPSIATGKDPASLLNRHHEHHHHHHIPLNRPAIPTPLIKQSTQTHALSKQKSTFLHHISSSSKLSTTENSTVHSNSVPSSLLSSSAETGQKKIKHISSMPDIKTIENIHITTYTSPIEQGSMNEFHIADYFVTEEEMSDDNANTSHDSFDEEERKNSVFGLHIYRPPTPPSMIKFKVQSSTSHSTNVFQNSPSCVLYDACDESDADEEEGEEEEIIKQKYNQDNVSIETKCNDEGHLIHSHPDYSQQYQLETPSNISSPQSKERDKITTTMKDTETTPYLDDQSLSNSSSYDSTLHSAKLIHQPPSVNSSNHRKHVSFDENVSTFEFQDWLSRLETHRLSKQEEETQRKCKDDGHLKRRLSTRVKKILQIHRHHRSDFCLNDKKLRNLYYRVTKQHPQQKVKEEEEVYYDYPYHE